MSKQYVYGCVITLSGMVVLILTGMLSYFYIHISDHARITIVTDPNFSAAGALLIKKALLAELPLTADLTHVFSRMRSKFCCINTLEATLYAPRRVEYKISALLPLYKVNSHLVIAPNRMLMSQEWYTKDLLATLPTITTEQSFSAGVAPQGLYALATKLTKSILNDYDAIFCDETATKLMHKTIPDLSIICNATCINNSMLYTQCKKMYEHLVKTTTLAKQYTLAMQADVRFANQIVIHSEKKRMPHG